MEKTSFSNTGSVDRRLERVHEAVNRLEEEVAELEGRMPPDATDAAKSLANEHGVDLDEVYGTGKDGRVKKGDVEDYLDGREDADQEGDE